MIKAILLDMYGVIIKQTGDDFVPYIHRTHPELTAEQIQSPWFRANAGEVTSLDIWRELGFTEDPEELEKEYLDTLELNDNVLDFLRSAQGKYKLALISNDSSGWSRYVREKFQLNQYFDAISISGDIGIKKPDERIFRMTPIHHAFEMRGWREVKIDGFFALIAVIGVAMGIFYICVA